MTRKEHHTVGIEISIIGSRVVGQATGIDLHMHSRDLVFLYFGKRSLEDLREHGYTAAETIYEAVQRSGISMIWVPTYGRQASLHSYITTFLVHRKIGAIKTIMDG